MACNCAHIVHMGEEIARSFAHFPFLQGGETSTFSSILTVLQDDRGVEQTDAWYSNARPHYDHYPDSLDSKVFGGFSNTNGRLSFVVEMSVVQLFPV